MADVQEVLNKVAGWLLGPPDYSVVRDDHLWVDVYAVPTSRVVAGDNVLATGLRFKAAQRYARRMREAEALRTAAKAAGGAG